MFGCVQILPNVELGSLSLKQILKCQSQSVLTGTSFENFKQEFTCTNYIGDNFRSIQRVKIEYLSENLINKNLGLYDEVDDLKNKKF